MNPPRAQCSLLKLHIFSGYEQNTTAVGLPNKHLLQAQTQANKNDLENWGAMLCACDNSKG